MRQYDGEGSLKNIVNLIDPIPAFAGMTKGKRRDDKKTINPPRHCVTPLHRGEFYPCPHCGAGEKRKRKNKKIPQTGDFLFHTGRYYIAECTNFF